MDIVNFLTIEEGDDLILAFSFDEGTRFGMSGFILQRTPKFESFLRPDERGLLVDWTDEDERILVRKANLTSKQIAFETTRESLLFDVSKISEKEYSEMVSILKKMNFDKAFDLKITE